MLCIAMMWGPLASAKATTATADQAITNNLQSEQHERMSLAPVQLVYTFEATEANAPMKITIAYTRSQEVSFVSCSGSLFIALAAIDYRNPVHFEALVSGKLLIPPTIRV